MVIFKNYADLITDIEATKEQLRTIEHELEYWSFNGEGGWLFGANTSLIQLEKKNKIKNKLIARLEYLERSKTRTEMLLNKFQGLDYKIAYLRICENMTHKEIADELGYSEIHVRRLWSQLKDDTKMIQTN